MLKNVVVNMESYFSILNPPGIISIAFLIHREIDPFEFHYVYKAVHMESSFDGERVDDSEQKVDFYIDEIDIQGNPVMLFKIDPKQGTVYCNKGFLDTSGLKLSDKAEVFHSRVSKELYVDELLKQVENRKESLYEYSNSSDRDIWLVDCLHGKIVKPFFKYDEENGRMCQRILLKPNYPFYYAFEIRGDSENGERLASAYEIGHAYEYGEYGIKCDIFRAICWYECARLHTEQILDAEPFFYLIDKQWYLIGKDIWVELEMCFNVSDE